MQKNDLCILVANGLFPTRKEILRILCEAPFVVACDGAVVALEKYREPDAIVGDLDSLPQELQQRYADRIHRMDEQETNDLTKAVSYVQELGYKEVLLLGTTGLREDHTLGNISLLMEYAPNFERIEILSDFGRFTPIRSTTTFKSKTGEQISLISLNPHGVISVEGLLYPIHKRRLLNWWEATLNEAIGNEFTIILEEDARILVYRATEK